MASRICAAFLAMAIFPSSVFAFDLCEFFDDLPEYCAQNPSNPILCGPILWLVGLLCDDEPEPGTVDVTFRILNNVGDESGCENKTLYYKTRWLTESGIEESTVTSLGPGGVSTLFISAYDSEGNGVADYVDFLCVVGNPDVDKLDGCVTGTGSAEDVLLDGDWWIITVNPDGTITDQITPAGSGSGLLSALGAAVGLAKPSSAKAASKPKLEPIPDPVFTPEPSSAQGGTKPKLEPIPAPRVSPRR